MTATEAITKLISVAKSEIGYLEKASKSSLYEKTTNAGNGNYTKYWDEIKPEYQGQPWCACFVTWVFVKAFGQAMAEKLLKHYPYVYCPTMPSLFALNANPKIGDIVIFYYGGVFTHTGIVTGVNGDYFTTIEGNTSGGSTIIANGGGVCAKGYYNSNLPGTKFCTPDWSLLADINNEEEIDMAQYEELNAKLISVDNSLANLYNIVAEIKEYVNTIGNPMIYNYIDGNMPDWARPTVRKLVGKGLLVGNENGELGLTDELLRILVINDRAGLYD